MLLNPDEFPFLPPLESGFETFSKELAQLGREDFVDWPVRAAYLGQWLVFPLILEMDAPELVAQCPANQAKCPESTRYLQSLPQLRNAGFSWLEPGCHILPHIDDSPNNHVRVHLGLEIPGGSQMRVGADHTVWRPGRCTIMDGHTEHEAINESTTERRVLLLTDFELTASESATRDRALHRDSDGH